LVEIGYSPEAIKHRIANGRLHPMWRGVYALGRPHLTQHGRWMAAVLSCGSGALLSHGSAAALWGVGVERGGEIEVSVLAPRCPRQSGIVVHRRAKLTRLDRTTRHGIPVTSAASTLVDLATRLGPEELEAAVNEADKRQLIDPEALRVALDTLPQRPGVAPLRTLLDGSTFTLTDSELERRFLRIARGAGLPLPQTGRYLNGFKVDFYWPELGLVVETDGLRYHRTSAQQSRDRVRDQAHAAAGLTPLRFSHAQVSFQPRHVEKTLAAIVPCLRAGPSPTTVRPDTLRRK
jgi:very-short-patch-repair endonuclease